MLETPHVAVGAAIASKIPNPFIAIPLSFLSHFALELVPHWNPHLNTEIKKHGKLTKRTLRVIAIDVAASLFVGGVVAYRVFPDTAHAATILLSCFAAALPDILESPYFLFGVKNRVLDKWIRFQKLLQNDADLPYGLITQGIVFVATIFWIVS